MAGFTTHNILGAQTRQSITCAAQREAIDSHAEAYQLGLQGPDFYFYNLFSTVSPRYALGEILHDADTAPFFEFAVRYIRRQTDIFKKETLTAYLCGYLGHLAMDSHIHPFVFAQTEYVLAAAKQDKDNFGKHSWLELNMDVHFLKSKLGLSAKQFHPEQTIDISRAERACISDLLTHCIVRTCFAPRRHDRSFVRFIYALTRCSLFVYPPFIHVLHNPGGGRRRFIQWVESKLIGFIVVSNVMMTEHIKDDSDFANHGHNPWFDPWKPESARTDSIEDIFDAAAADHLRFLRLFDEALRYDKCLSPFVSTVGRHSFHSGISAPCKVAVQQDNLGARLSVTPAAPDRQVTTLLGDQL